MITTSHEFSFSADDLCIFVRLNKLERHDCHDQGGMLLGYLPILRMVIRLT